MSVDVTAPFSRVYGDETPKAAPPAMGASDRDSKFQTFMSKLVDSLHESDISSRDSKQSGREREEEFDAMRAFAGRQMKDDTERVVQHQQQGPAVTAAATMAQPNPHAAREMNALLKTEQASKPIDGPKNTNSFANNAESASKGAENKAVAAERGADQLVKKASDIAAKMNPQDVAAMAAQPKGGIGGMAAEMGLHATGHPAAAVAVGVASAVLSAEGQGTYAANKTPSKPILSKSEQRAQAKAPSYYYDQAPQAIAAPSPSANTAQFFDKMGKGPGFGNDLSARSSLAGQSLDDLKVGNIAKVIEDTPAMKSIKSAGIDADKTKTALLDMKGKGLVDDGGKQTVKEELQAFVKPAAPSPPGFRT